MLYSILFKSDYLLFSKKSVSLQCVFHSIRFKVNKGWSKALLLFYFILHVLHAHDLRAPRRTEVGDRTRAGVKVV